MQILFFNHNYQGIGTYFRCYFLARHLVKNGCDVTILTVSREPILKMKRERTKEGIEMILLPHLKIGERYFAHFLRTILGCITTIGKRFDIVHGFCVALPATAIPTLMHKFLRKSIIFTDWDEIWTGSVVELHPSSGKKIITFLEKKIPSFARGITVVSEFLRDKAIRYGFRKDNIHYIPNGTNLEAMKLIEKTMARQFLKIDESIPIIVSVANTYMGRTFEHLLGGFSRLLQSLPNAKLLLVGHPGFISKDVETRFNISLDNVIFTGTQPYEKVLYYQAAADVLVLPMEDNDNERARFPIRLGDYLVAGRPIVSNAVGEVKRILEEDECGLTCSPDNIVGFGDLMFKAITDKSLKERLGNRPLGAAKKYSWDKITTNLIKIYEQAMTE